MISRVNRAFQDVFRATLNSLAKKQGESAATDTKDLLIDAQLSGNYDELARYVADSFWEVADHGFAAVEEYRNYFAVLVETFPPLREPLQKALDEGNPYLNLLPAVVLNPVSAPVVSGEGPWSFSQGDSNSSGDPDDLGEHTKFPFPTGDSVGKKDTDNKA